MDCNKCQNECLTVWCLVIGCILLLAEGKKNYKTFPRLNFTGTIESTERLNNQSCHEIKHILHRTEEGMGRGLENCSRDVCFEQYGAPLN